MPWDGTSPFPVNSTSMLYHTSTAALAQHASSNEDQPDAKI